MWMLKSPVMINWCGVVVAVDRKVENSDRNVENAVA